MSENEIGAVAIISRHVTERKQLEQHVQDAQAYADNILATLRDPFLVLDKSLRVVTANHAFYETFHVAPEETQGCFVYELGNHQWDIPRLRTLLEEVLPQNHAFQDFEVEHDFATVGRKVMLLNARRIRKPGRSSELILLAIEDITERSRLESLERERAAELSDMHRRKDEFLAMLSHELRSPLAPIANAVQLLGLQRGSENQIQQQARSIIERQLKQLQHLVDDLLEVSRFTTGKVQLRRKRVAVRSIVGSSVETVRPLIEQCRQELTVSLPTEPIWLHADAARLEQVLVNLLSNAAKYSEEGGHVWLTVELEVDKTTRWQGDKVTKETESSVSPHLVTSSPCHHVAIRVRDTGVGISPSLLPRIFDLFTQAEQSLDRSQGGLGIGLALVQQLTELHEGKVEASSLLGKGSEFVVRLPLLEEEGGKMKDESGTGPSESSVVPDPSSLKVLVVDDNADTVLSFSMILEMSGHDVRTAHDGPTALQVALDYRPDVVLLDIGLPGLNGYEVAKRIRKQPDFKNVVLVALTGYGQDSDRQTALQAGFNHHMTKPVCLPQLEQILTTASVSGMTLASGVATSKSA